ncbi:MAG: hypothetical protein AUK31_05270 [Fibrobacteres bacterium CG2_30_45_31]|nr:MAG: hypothetical protein AUK31_05270 [Fibrobacteres bacterium CG2_30_45_31]
MLLDIYGYMDYRIFLRDYYAKRKASKSYFSYRHFARKAGFTSSGLYPNIVKGLRNLSPKYLPKFAIGLGLSARETEYFRLLVDYTHCTNDGSRSELFAAMSVYLPDRVKRLFRSQRQFYSCWENVVIYQALHIVRIKDDFRTLATFLRPNPGLVRIRKSINLLESMGLVVRSEDGYLCPIHSNLMGGEELGADLIRQFQSSLLDLGKTAYERFPKDSRYQISETLAISATLAEHFRERLRDLHHEIVQQALQEPLTGQVVLQINLQLFPVSEVSP